MAVITEQAFLDLLTEIQHHSRTMVYVPPSEPSRIINVNLETREIDLKNSPYREFLSINKDHYAETLFFKVPRYFDNVDLNNMALVIEYVNAKGVSYVSPILVKDIITYPGYILFGWCIHGNATETAGSLQFAIHFYSINQSTRVLEYSLSTRPVSGKILYGIPLSEREKNVEATLSNNNNLDIIISQIAQHTTLAWHNL